MAEPADTIEVSDETHRKLADIARRLNCNIPAALEVVISEFVARGRADA